MIADDCNGAHAERACEGALLGKAGAYEKEREEIGVVQRYSDRDRVKQEREKCP